MSDFIMVFITTCSRKEAEKIGKNLVEEKLVACANIVPNITSIFVWEKKLCQEKECLVIAKSRRKKFPLVIKRVKELHSYKVPEIIAVPIIAGSLDYLKWVREST